MEVIRFVTPVWVHYLRSVAKGDSEDTCMMSQLFTGAINMYLSLFVHVYVFRVWGQVSPRIQAVYGL